MNKLLNQYRKYKALIKEKYSKDEINNSYFIPLSVTLLFYFPVVLALVYFFNFYIMRPYLCFILCGITAIFIALFFTFSRKRYLKSIKTIEEIDYNFICYFEFVHLLVLITILCIVSMLILTPIFII